MQVSVSELSLEASLYLTRQQARPTGKRQGSSCRPKGHYKPLKLTQPVPCRRVHGTSPGGRSKCQGPPRGSIRLRPVSTLLAPPCWQRSWRGPGRQLLLVYDGPNLTTADLAARGALGSIAPVFSPASGLAFCTVLMRPWGSRGLLLAPTVLPSWGVQ